MCLLEMKTGDKAIIDSLNMGTELKHRLNAMGLMKDSRIEVNQYGWFKSTVQIMINRSLIAIRRDEALLIEVHKIV